MERNIATTQQPWGWGLDLSTVPEATAISRWSDPGYETGNGIDLDSLQKIVSPSSCIDKKLYPTHPQQFTKIYHTYRVAEYDYRKVPYNSEVCTIRNRPSSAAGKRFCLFADSYVHVVISDIFQDGCGNLYRGVWQVDFLKNNENLGTLYSKGRTLYQNSNSDFNNDMVVGQTYASDLKEFLFLAPLFEGDMESIKIMKKDSQKTHNYDPHTHLYQRKTKTD